MKTRMLIAAIIFSAPIYSDAAESQDCDSYPEKINRLQQLNARGGTSRQQAQRRKKIGHYEAALYQCRNSKHIWIAQGSQKFKKNQRKTMPLSESQAPQLQQLIKTCNYWVEQTNRYPSWHNNNFRDTACRAADENQKAMHNRKAPPHVRKLNDCIKPNKVIDDEVKNCIQGASQSRWKK